MSYTLDNTSSVIAHSEVHAIYKKVQQNSRKSDEKSWNFDSPKVSFTIFGVICPLEKRSKPNSEVKSMHVHLEWGFRALNF